MKNGNRRGMPARLAALALAAVLVLCAAVMPAQADGRFSAQAEEILDFLPRLDRYGWPAYMTDESREIIKPQCGPGNEYPVFKSMNGSKSLYRIDEMTRADIYFRVGDWVYVGFGYSDKKWRCGFFRKSLYEPYDGPETWDAIPEYSLDYGAYGTIIRDTVPWNGPNRGGGEYTSCELYAGDEVFAVMESGGWYLCRFWNGHTNHYGYVYLWVPGSSISWY